MLDIAVWTGGATIALFALDRLFLWLEARGWIYWRKVKSKSSGGDILTGFGFSDPGTRHLVEARREHVLEDEEVRQGIKEYANWPTIPQLYIDGEFVGGSDIMMEMYESGELQQVISNQG